VASLERKMARDLKSLVFANATPGFYFWGGEVFLFFTKGHFVKSFFILVA
jgi:hypothetical protein